MPIYEYACKRCKDVIELYRRVDERHRGVRCSGCGDQATLSLSIPANAYVSGYPYHDPVLGREISSPGDRRQEMRKQGLEERG